MTDSPIVANPIEGDHVARKQVPGRRRLWLFRAMAVLGALALLLLAEGLCRLIGFGGHPPVWKKVAENLTDGVALYETDSRAIQQFFPRASGSGIRVHGSFQVERALMPKPAGQFRVAIAGESTVQGFPFPRNLAAASFLEANLRVLAPGTSVQVLNLGVTAVASHPVRAIVEQSLEALDLDLLIVYTGHNEFYGASGVASTQSGLLRVGGRDGGYLLRGLGLVQLLERLADMAVTGPAAEGAEARVNLIEEMAAVGSIEPGGQLHREAARVFEANLRGMVAAGRKRGVPVILSTLASNEKDLRPVRIFGEEAPSATTSAALALLVDDRPIDSKLEVLGRMAGEHPKNGMIPWVRGRLLHDNGKGEEALADFARARDLDAMPWRATTEINQVIRKVAGAEGALLVDAEAAFRAESVGGVGWELMADHLHPSIEGQALLGETLAQAIVDADLLPGAREGAQLVDRAELVRSLGGGRLEVARVYRRMTDLFGIPPLGANNQVATDYLRRRASEATAEFDPIENVVQRRINAAPEELEADGGINFALGRAAMEAGDYEQAAMSFGAAGVGEAPFSAARVRARYLALLCSRQTRPLDARQTVELIDALAEASYAEPLAETKYLGRLYGAVAGLRALAGDRQEADNGFRKALAAGFQPGATEASLLARVAADRLAAGSTTTRSTGPRPR